MERFLTLLGLAIIGCREAAFANHMSRVAVELQFSKGLLGLLVNPEGFVEKLTSILSTVTQATESSGDDILKERCAVYTGLVKSIAQDREAMASMAVSDIDVATIEAIGIGLERIAAALRRNDRQRCEIEAEHIHNLPGTLNVAYRNSRRYYAETERQFFLDRLREGSDDSTVLEAKVAFARLWKLIDEAS